MLNSKVTNVLIFVLVLMPHGFLRIVADEKRTEIEVAADVTVNSHLDNVKLQPVASTVGRTNSSTGVTSLTQCKEERECKAACGASASDTRCDTAFGNCVCLNEYGPSRRCRNLNQITNNPKEQECTTRCKRRIAQACYTDFGTFCSCFVRN